MTCDSIDPRVFISKVDQIIGDRGFYDVILFDCPSFIMFHLDDCPRARDILTHGKFEPMSMKLWCRLVKDATGILDIGAQVGVYSLAAAALRSDITIHAFEPNPDAYARLELHRRANGFGNIKTYRWALSSFERVVPFSWIDKGYISSGGRMSRPTVQSNQVTTVYAQAMPLDRTAIAASLGDRPLVKIDVEGAEVAVIDGMASVLALRPDIILETFSVANCARLNAELLPMGYSVFKIVESGKLEPLNMIMPADPNGEDFNQFLTVRPECVRDFL